MLPDFVGKKKSWRDIAVTDYCSLLVQWPAQQAPPGTSSTPVQALIPQVPGRQTQELSHRRSQESRVLISSAVEALLTLLADHLEGVYGPNAHLATLGEALVQAWAEPFKNPVCTYQDRALHQKSCDAFGAELQQLCRHMKLQLECGQCPAEKLRQAASTLAS